MLTVRRIQAGEGQLLRRIRLAALADAPGDATTTVTSTAAHSADHWDQAAEANAGGASQATFFAEDEGEVVGMLGAYMMADAVVTLVGLWSAPGFRDVGVAEALLDTVADWATRSGGGQLRLWVVERNQHALKFYARQSFRPTGETMPYELDPSIREVEMIRPLPAPT